MNNKSILIVEDEEKIAQVLEDYFTAAGYRCSQVHDGAAVMEVFLREQPAAIILDVMLPKLDGLSVCRQIRACSNVPILILSAKVEEIDRILGLELGADDYICKPFSPREVVARVQAVLRRANNDSDLLALDASIVLDELQYCLRYTGISLELTAVEFALFATLYKSPQRIFSRQHLMDSMYKDNRIVSERTIDSHIKKLRQKIEATFLGVKLIHSVYAVGYKYEFIQLDELA